MNQTNPKITVIGSNIKKLRAAKNLSQDGLSKIADISFNTLTKIEAGDTPNPTIDTLKKIANGLGVGVDDLIK